MNTGEDIYFIEAHNQVHRVCNKHMHMFPRHIEYFKEMIEFMNKELNYEPLRVDRYTRLFYVEGVRRTKKQVKEYQEDVQDSFKYIKFLQDAIPKVQAFVDKY